MKRKKEEEANKKILSKTKFAGEEFLYEKELTDKEKKKIDQLEKNKTHKTIDSIVNDISKKKEINIFDKTKVDWEKFVDKNNLAKDLDYARKDGYLAKKRFIESVNYNLFVHRKEEEKKHNYLVSLKNKK